MWPGNKAKGLLPHTGPGPGAHLYCSCSQRSATIVSRRLMKDSLLLSLFACAAKRVHLFSVSANFFCSLTYSCRRSIKCFSNLATSSARETKNQVYHSRCKADSIHSSLILQPGWLPKGLQLTLEHGVELHGSTYTQICFISKYIQYYTIHSWLNPKIWRNQGHGGLQITRRFSTVLEPRCSQPLELFKGQLQSRDIPTISY